MAVDWIHLAAAPGTLAARRPGESGAENLIILPAKRGLSALSGMVDWPQKTCASMYARAPTVWCGRGYHAHTITHP
jgi:hypothetical protein